MGDRADDIEDGWAEKSMKEQVEFIRLKKVATKELKTRQEKCQVNEVG